MNRRWLPAAVAALVALSRARSTAAQTPADTSVSRGSHVQKPQEVVPWATVALTRGPATLPCSGYLCLSAPDGVGSAVFLQVGVDATRHVGVGLETFSWGSDSGVTLRHWSLAVYYRPDKEFFFRFGPSYGLLTWSATAVTRKGDGLGFLLGLGLTVPITRNLFVSPMASYYRVSLDKTAPALEVGGWVWKEQLWVVGLGITPHR